MAPLFRHPALAGNTQVCIPPVAGSALEPALPTPTGGAAPSSKLPGGLCPASQLRAPVSLAVSAVSSRTLVNNAGLMVIPCHGSGSEDIRITNAGFEKSLRDSKQRSAPTFF